MGARLRPGMDLGDGARPAGAMATSRDRPRWNSGRGTTRIRRRGRGPDGLDRGTRGQARGVRPPAPKPAPAEAHRRVRAIARTGRDAQTLIVLGLRDRLLAAR